MSLAEYRAAVADLERRGIMPEKTPDLAPMREGLRRLAVACDPDRVIVVAGTNGKGSTCASLEALLRATGASVGLYTSPHLVEATERIRRNGLDLTREAFVQAWSAVRERGGEVRLSHFEMLTLMAAWTFFSGECGPKVDYAIFEVGLGGLWDATNAIPHRICGITRLGFDHEKFLGNTIASIAANKFGIVTPASLVVHAPFPDIEREAVRSLAQETAERTRSQWREATPCGVRVRAANGVGRDPEFILESPWGDVRLSLAGSRAGENSSVAITLFETLGFDPAKYLPVLSKVQWPGRMQRREFPGAPCPVYLSGDHNPQGVASLLELLPHYPCRRWHFLVGVGLEKVLDGILGPLSRVPNAELYLTETSFRGRPIEQYGSWLERAVAASKDARGLLNTVFARASADDRILVTGSLYLVGELSKP